MLTGNKAGGQTQLCKENLPHQGEDALSGRVGAIGRRGGCCLGTPQAQDAAHSDAAALTEVS